MLGSAGVLLVTRDEPLVPLACQGVRLSLSERLPLAFRCCAYRRDPGFNLGRPILVLGLGLLHRRLGGQRELGFPTWTVEALVLPSHVFGDASASGVGARF